MEELDTRRLKESAVRGGFWVFFLRIFEKGFAFVRLIILARLLAPRDFGILGVAMLTIATLETFSMTGFQDALIQKKEDIAGYLDTAWTILVIRGVIIFAILFWLAPPAALFFASPEAKGVIRMISLSVILEGLTNIGLVHFNRDLDFKRRFYFQSSGVLVDFVVSLVLAVILRNVWALVWGLLAGQTVKVFVSFVIHPFRPRFSLSMAQTRELFGYGKWILGSKIVNFFLTQGDDLLVGKLLGIRWLGFYQMAYKVSNLPATEVTHVISQVLFPTYSKLQDNIPKLKDAYLKALAVIAFFSFPIGGFFMVTAPYFTDIFLGDKWAPMVPAMQVLALWGIIRSIGATTGPVFKAVKRPDLVTRIQFAKLVLLLALIYPFTAKWGILGASWAVVLAAFIINPIADYLTIKIINCRVGEFIKPLLLSAASTLGMAAVLYGVIRFVLRGVDVWAFLGLSVLAVGAYLIFSIILKAWLRVESGPIGLKEIGSLLKGIFGHEKD